LQLLGVICIVQNQTIFLLITIFISLLNVKDHAETNQSLYNTPHSYI
jgi:hypothetical protein